jgi:hypothetical protein
MFLSDAIVLGSTLGELKPYDINSCALGMAGNTMGIEKAEPLYFGKVQADATVKDQNKRVDKIIEIWPWLRCMDSYPGEIFKWTYAKIIMRMFDGEVCTGKRTLESLVEYIRSVEPKCGECHYFNCQCKNLAVFSEETVKENVYEIA